MSKPQEVGLDGAIRLSRRIGDGDIKRGDTILEVRDLGVKFWVNGEWFDAADEVNNLRETLVIDKHMIVDRDSKIVDDRLA